MHFLLPVSILIPLVAGLVLLIFSIKDYRRLSFYVFAAMLITSAMVMFGVFKSELGFEIIRFGPTLSLGLKSDGLSKIFISILATLWPISSIYAFEYMKPEQNQNRFFAFWLMSYAVCIGIGLAQNPLTLYLFIELLTLVTLPLVMHAGDAKAGFAGRNYLLYSMGGAAIGFIALVYIIKLSSGSEFIFGGFKLSREELDFTLYGFFFILGFIGFGTKGAILPFSRWLIDASIAPTPVTALLHAVAVVNAGVFATIRLAHYSFSPSLLYGSHAQSFLLFLTAATILYGAFSALRTPHLKRRLAYSTISNLSYMFFAVAIMTKDGLVAANIHMVFHAYSKIVLFFCSGAVYRVYHREYVYELKDLGYRLPLSFLAFTLASFGLICLPPLGNFTSKWMICTAAMETGHMLSYFGISTLVISTVLSALYLMSAFIPAWLPEKDFEGHISLEKQSGSALMNTAIWISLIIYFIISLYSNKLIPLIENLLLG